MNHLLTQVHQSYPKNLAVFWIIIAIFGTAALSSCQDGNVAFPHSNNGTPIDSKLPLLPTNTDIKESVLKPADVSDYFAETTYSVSQPISDEHSQGLILTYPTEMMAHTSAFSYGFSTQINLFNDANLAAQAYQQTFLQQSGDSISISEIGDSSNAFTRNAVTPEGANLNSTEYFLMFRDANAVITIILRTDKKISADRLRQLGQLIDDRLRAQQ